MTDPVAFGDFRQRLAELCGLRGELGVGGDKNIDLVFDGLFEILAAYFQCVRVNAIGNDEDLASRRIGTQPGQDANRVAGCRQRQFSDNDSRIDLIDEMRMLNQHVARQVENTAFERSEEHTSELQSLMRISYAVFCLNKKN